jgi:hypothetical protein
LKENPKEVEPKSITNFEEPELAIDFEEWKSITDSKKLESPGHLVDLESIYSQGFSNYTCKSSGTKWNGKSFRMKTKYT